MNMRDDFTNQTKEMLSKRVGHFCSNPGCRHGTSGPQDDPLKAINVGVAAHITAASEGGPRYDSSIASEDRAHIDNGIWLCQTCAKLVDSDTSRYTASLLREWRRTAEIEAALALQNRGHARSDRIVVYAKVERLMPKLLAEMRSDLEQNPYVREFIAMSKFMLYGYSDKLIFTYYLEDHSDLHGKLDILQNYALIRDARFNDVPRFLFEEEFVDYLGSKREGSI